MPLSDTARKALLILVWSLSCLGFGYAWRYHRDSIKDTRREAVQETATAGVAAHGATVDSAALTTLGADLRRTEAQNKYLQQKLNEARDANPAADGCRLPDGVRSELNRQLGTR